MFLLTKKKGQVLCLSLTERKKMLLYWENETSLCYYDEGARPVQSSLTLALSFVMPGTSHLLQASTLGPITVYTSHRWFAPLGSASTTIPQWFHQLLICFSLCYYLFGVFKSLPLLSILLELLIWPFFSCVDRSVV